MGDATRQRIDDLAEGWSVKDGEDAEQASPRAKPVSAPPPPRAKRPSAPPPPPGAKRTSAPPPPPRPKRASAPPPAPRAKRASAVPPQPPEIDTVPTPKHDLVIGSADVPDDATVLQTPESMSFVVNEGQAGQVRQRPSLPRKRGIFGDIRYVFTAMFGIAGARRELAEVNAKLDRERDGRDDRLLQSMRDMIADPDVDTPLMERAREQLSTIEDQRSRKAGAGLDAEAEPGIASSWSSSRA